MIHVGDNTWNLRILITDLQVEKTLRVKGDLHIGGVMLKLSKTEGEFRLITSLQFSGDLLKCRNHFSQENTTKSFVLQIKFLFFSNEQKKESRERRKKS